MIYSPDSFVEATDSPPRSVSIAVTRAPATTPPEESFTAPTMAPVSFCAAAGIAKIDNKRNIKPLKR